jgi:prephenate dehydrogenase
MAQITLIGLDTLGISLGLALRQTAQPPTIVGVDRDGAEARRAQQLGAVERTEAWAANACKNAALVILNEPFSRLRDMLAAIATSLPEGCVVTSTAPLMVPVLAWADELLPKGISFIAGHPVLNPLKPVTEPSADLFKQAQYCIVPSARANTTAMDLVSSLATSIGAQPFFSDAAEHDGLVTAVEGLPGLLGTLLMSAAAEASSWRDMRRVAGPGFAQATQSAQDDPASRIVATRANRENLARWLETCSSKLSEARAALLAEDEAQLTQLITGAHEACDQWLRDSARANWEGIAEMPKVSMGQMLGNLVWPQRQPRDSQQDKKRKK